MRRFIPITAALAILAPLCSCAEQPVAPSEITLEVVKQKGYLEKLAGFRGKVVVVDVWGEFCIPCKKEFPHLVELHEKYAVKGVACMSVSLDVLDGKGAALNFLKKHHASFTNVLLDEPPKVWQEVFDIYGPPAVLVFDKTGKVAARFDHNDVNKSYSYADVDQAVAKLVAK